MSGIKVYSVACTFPKIFWYLNFYENVPMTVATRLFWHFVTAAASLPANLTHSDATKQAKNLTSLFLAYFHTTAACRSPEQWNSRGRGAHLYGHTCTPAHGYARSRAAWGGKLITEQQAFSFVVQSLQPLSHPIQLTSSIKLNGAIIVLYLKQIWECWARQW